MVYILLAEGFEEIEALAPADLLRRAGISVALVGVGGMEVRGGHGITVRADLVLSQVELEDMQLLVLPGGRVGVDTLRGEPAVLDLIRAAAKRQIPLGAICAGPTLLGELGLLQDRQAVCYPGLEGALTGAQIQPNRQVVQDDFILTGRAAGASLDFGLALIRRLRGPEKAREVARGICYFTGEEASSH